jgi:hypothetical protein
MGTNSAEDAAAKNRKEVLERLKRGEKVKVTYSGKVVKPQDPEATGDTIEIDKGILAASFYWYERSPELLAAERLAMRKYFPSFQMEKLDDGRLCWVGDLNPSGAAGGVWTLQAIYDNDHPHNKRFGGSIRVYSIKPDLDELYKEVHGLPHVLPDEYDHYYMCTARMEDVDEGGENGDVTSASKSISWAVKWILMVEAWMNDDISREEAFGHTF